MSVVIGPLPQIAPNFALGSLELILVLALLGLVPALVVALQESDQRLPTTSVS